MYIIVSHKSISINLYESFKIHTRMDSTHDEESDSSDSIQIVTDVKNERDVSPISTEVSV